VCENQSWLPTTIHREVSRILRRRRWAKLEGESASSAKSKREGYLPHLNFTQQLTFSSAGGGWGDVRRLQQVRLGTALKAASPYSFFLSHIKVDPQQTRP